MKLRTLIAALMFAVAGSAFAAHCPMDMKKIDEAMSKNPSLPADKLAEVKQLRAEGESFTWGALPALLAGNYDIVHTLEREVCSTLWANRHLFERTPRRIVPFELPVSSIVSGGPTCRTAWRREIDASSICRSFSAVRPIVS